MHYKLLNWINHKTKSKNKRIGFQKECLITFFVIFCIYSMTNCSLVRPEEIDSYKHIYEIEIINNYDKPASVTVNFDDPIEIPANSSHFFLVGSSYSRSSVRVRPQGVYFRSYLSKTIDLCDHSFTTYALEADRGWFGIKNLTGQTIVSLRYGNTSFNYKDDFSTYVSGYKIEPNEIRYMEVRERDYSDDDLSFRYDGSFVNRSISIDETPTVGQIILIEVSDSNVD